MIVSFCGSSGVGKTSTMNLWGEKDIIYPVTLSARQPREKMGNPDFSTLSSYKAKNHQLFILEFFKIKVEDLFKHNSVTNDLMVVERSLYDVLGYTYAFLRPDHEFITYFKHQISQFYARMSILYGVTHKIVYFPINESVKYEEIPERPNIKIRKICDNYLHSLKSYEDWSSVTSTSILENVVELQKLTEEWRKEQ